MQSSPDPVRRRRSVVIATDDAFLASWLVFAVRATGCRAIVVTEPAALFDVLARRAPVGVIVTDALRGVPAEALLAMARTAGCPTPAIVVGPFDPGVIRIATRALQPLELLGDPLDGVALASALRRMLIVPGRVRGAAADYAGVATS